MACLNEEDWKPADVYIATAGPQGASLLRVLPSPETLPSLLSSLMGAALQAIHRTADGEEELSVQFLQLLGVLFEPVEEQGGWMIDWLWEFYKVCAYAGSGGGKKQALQRSLCSTNFSVSCLTLLPPHGVQKV
jgi:hypothetical protein